MIAGSLFELGERKPTIHGADSIFVAEGAKIIGDVHLHKGCSIWFQAVLRGDEERISVGENSNIQDGCLLHTDPGFPLSVGKGCTVGHKAILHGCRVGDGSLVGMGACLQNGAQVGPGSLVAAGSLVTEGKEFPGGVLILGSPARLLRKLTPQEKSMLEQSAIGYCDRAASYKSQLGLISS